MQWIFPLSSTIDVAVICSITKQQRHQHHDHSAATRRMAHAWLKRVDLGCAARSPKQELRSSLKDFHRTTCKSSAPYVYLQRVSMHLFFLPPPFGRQRSQSCRVAAMLTRRAPRPDCSDCAGAFAVNNVLSLRSAGIPPRMTACPALCEAAAASIFESITVLSAENAMLQRSSTERKALVLEAHELLVGLS